MGPMDPKPQAPKPCQDERAPLQNSITLNPKPIEPTSTHYGTLAKPLEPLKRWARMNMHKGLCDYCVQNGGGIPPGCSSALNPKP